MVSGKKIYDCFTFYNELDLLEIRLEEIYEYIDHFVICEATTTFRGQAKPLYYLENKERFKKYEGKIIHVVVDDMPGLEKVVGKSDLNEYEPAIWGREHFQRNAIRRGLTGAGPDDVVIISDCDEIPHPVALQYLRENSGYFMFDMAMYQFYMNMQAQKSGWLKVFAYTYSNDASFPDYNVNRTNERAVLEKFVGDKHVMQQGGWHFTFLGGINSVMKKLEAYSHTDGWQRAMWDQNNLKSQMLTLREVGGGKPLKFCRIDQSFPGRS